MRFSPLKHDGSPANYRIFLAEMLGMFVFTYVSCSTTASVVRGNARDPSIVTMQPSSFGNAGTIALGTGLGLALGVMLTMGVTKPHLNPAVTLALVFCGEVTWCLVPMYMAAQAAGAGIGAAFMFSIHGPGLNALPKAIGRQAFAISLLDDNIYNIATLLWEQLWLSSLYMIVYLAASDKHKADLTKRNSPEVQNDPNRSIVFPIALGVTYAGIFLVSSINAASTVNPAKDLFPRLMAYFLGFSSAMNSFLLVPLFVPFVGCPIGALIYYAAIGWLWPDVEQEGFTEEEERLLDLQDEIADLKELLLPPMPQEEPGPEEPIESFGALEKTEPGKTSLSKLFQS